MELKTSAQPSACTELLRQLSQAVETRDVEGGRRLARKAAGAMVDRHDPSAGQYRYLEARLFYLSGDYHDALASARLAASVLAPLGETRDLAEAYLLTGKILVNIGNYREAETAFLDAESLFRRNDAVTGRIDAANQLARVYFIRAEYRNALKYLLDAARLADSIGDQKTLAWLWGNIGRVHTFLGNTRKAIDALSSNFAISDELDDNRERARSLLSLGYVQMQSEMFDSAEARLDQAYLILVREKMQREMVICQTYYGELKLHRGEVTGARRHLDEAIDGARKLAPESSLMVAPLRHLAELELVDGNLNAACRLANKALALAEKINEPLEKGAALRILARAAACECDRRTDAERKAVNLFTRAMDIFEETGARLERANTLIQMAVCGVGSKRRILASLFNAADTYRRLGITAKYEKTQEMIRNVDAGPAGVASGETGKSDETPVIVTASRQFKQIMTRLSQAAKSELPVLLSGETGTGKDLLARYYHSQTGRSGQFVAVNCAAFPETLLEAELFGYRRGAFTGAGADKEGLLHRANGGTFFLDEIGEMPLSSQAKLLTVIETCRTRRLGDTVEEVLDIRFIAATNCDLATMVKVGAFRRDLFYRLSGICFDIPSLANRPEDIPLLLRHFLHKEGVLDDESAIDPGLIAEFTSRSWPGNVRQLESEVKKLVLFAAVAREDSLGDLAGILVQNDTDGETASLVNQVEQFERALILKALRKANGNKSQAARTLSIHESTLRAKMKRYEIDPAAIS